MVLLLVVSGACSSGHDDAAKRSSSSSATTRGPSGRTVTTTASSPDAGPEKFGGQNDELLEAGNLREGDLPAFVRQPNDGGGTNLLRDLPNCALLQGVIDARMSAESSDLWVSGPVRVSTAVLVFETEDRAAEVISALSGQAAERCLTDAGQRVLAAYVPGGQASVTPDDIGTAGDDRTSFKITASAPDRSAALGLSVVRVGRTDVVIATASIKPSEPDPASDVAEIVAARVAAVR